MQSYGFVVPLAKAAPRICTKIKGRGHAPRLVAAAMQHVKPAASECLAQAPKSYTKVTQKLQKLRKSYAKVAKQAATMIQHLAQCKMSCQPATQMYNLGM